ncbi:MAG TPA: SdpI family protein [Clostridiales bacterium]|nr:SdpI family protein [Clostridiales bacterium]
MDIFFWITDLFIPATMISLGVIFKKWPIKKINMVCGYRTRRSMLSQETWDYANYRMGVLWLKWGIVLFAAVAISKIITPVEKEQLSIIHAGVELVALFASIPIIETELKQKFDKSGKPKE